MLFHNLFIYFLVASAPFVDRQTNMSPPPREKYLHEREKANFSEGTYEGNPNVHFWPLCVGSDYWAYKDIMRSIESSGCTLKSYSVGASNGICLCTVFCVHYNTADQLQRLLELVRHPSCSFVKFDRAIYVDGNTHSLFFVSHRSRCILADSWDHLSSTVRGHMCGTFMSSFLSSLPIGWEPSGQSSSRRREAACGKDTPWRGEAAFGETSIETGSEEEGMESLSQTVCEDEMRPL